MTPVLKSEPLDVCLDKLSIFPEEYIVRIEKYTFVVLHFFIFVS